VRVLFISDVYFPRVNGVSTSIRTFRQDLANCGVETRLVAPRYDTDEPVPAGDSLADRSVGSTLGQPGDEPGLLRVASGSIPRDPEDRRMRWGPLTRLLDTLPRNEFDLVHIHTPFIAHYAGARFARRSNLPCVATYHTFFEEYAHHYVLAMPKWLGRYLARAFTRSQCDDVQGLIAPSEPMRDVLLEYGVTTPIHVLPRARGGSFRRRRRQSLPGAIRRACRSSVDDLHRAGRAREEYRLPH